MDSAGFFRRPRTGGAGKVYQVGIFSRTGAIPPIDYIKVFGGLFRDSSIHDLDMVRYLLGEEIASVYAVGGCLADEAIGAAGDIDTAMITQGASPLADQNDGLEAQRLAEAAVRSFREGRPVRPDCVACGPTGFLPTKD